jgi:hypothetical protein
MAGTAAIRMRAIHEMPFELMSRTDAKLRGSRILARVRAFVTGTELAGLVDVDLMTRRARVTLTAHGADPSCIVSARLIYVRPDEVLEAMRIRRAMGGRHG